MQGVLAGRVLEHWLRQYRSTWRASLFSGFLAPVLYLGSLGFGLGSLVDSGPRGGIDGVPYARFVAPGLLAATAMQTAIGESTYPVMGAIVWQRLYLGMLATPLGVLDVLAGHLSFVAVRLTIVSVGFAVVGTLLGAFTSWWVAAAVLVAVLCGLAHAAPVMAFAAAQEDESGFALIYRFALIPMFLFAGTFFPVDQLPAPIRPVAWATPLWHATQACRGLLIGRVDTLVVLAHVGYLLVWIGLGTLLAARSYRRRLVR
ncbi:MAG TPA: ABC transporter permease [Kineosporiaceae bacterium]|jgi:lipooligosaccharide transport system permease protein|nr:ABC transporter permease [Kineosporiaceae bacterium]